MCLSVRVYKLMCMCVFFQPEDSGRENSVCQIFSQLGERSHQTPGCQIYPHWGDIQPVTMAAACPLLDPARSNPQALSIFLALNILSKSSQKCLLFMNIREN